MVLTPTTQISLGYSASDFSLFNPLINDFQSLNELKSKKATLIIFMCNHCPYVVHVLDGLVDLANDYLDQDVSIIGINSNDIVKHPDDAPEKMVELINSYNIPFPYLFDETQEIAKAYHAACTPDFSIFNGDMECVYRGQMDDSRPGNNHEVTGQDLRLALDALLLNKKVDFPQKPSIGCNIKWKSV